MKSRIGGLAVLACILAVGPSLWAAGKGVVLMIVRPGSPDLVDLMLTGEVEVMRSTLEEEGFAVLLATVGDQSINGSTASLRPDVKISDVQVGDYRGVILPCMAAGESPVPAEAVTIVRKALDLKVPVAAQNSAVEILEQAGGLKGRRFAIESDLEFAFQDGTFSGTGVVADGKVVTSGTCPYMAQEMNLPDGTRELTREFIALMR